MKSIFDDEEADFVGVKLTDADIDALPVVAE